MRCYTPLLAHLLEGQDKEFVAGIQFSTIATGMDQQEPSSDGQSKHKLGAQQVEHTGVNNISRYFM